MKQAIVICTTPTASPWLPNLLHTLDGYDKYPILAVSNYGYELGKIHYIYENTDIDEFFLLHETTEIKNRDLFDMVFEQNIGKSVMLAPRANAYLVKYRREVLSKLTIPFATSKRAAVDNEWDGFNSEYFAQDIGVTLFPDWKDTELFEYKFGELRMKIENDYLVKWKGCWNPDMIHD